MFAQQALDELHQRLTRLGEHERARCFIPIQFEAGGLRGYPYLADGRVGRNHELARPILEQYVHYAVVVLELEAGAVVLGGDQRLLQRLERAVAFTAEGGFIQHGNSLAG